jgi:hypothetical protein
MGNITRLNCKLTPKIDFDTGILEIEERMESPFNTITGNFHRHIMDTKDEMIRKGLIALGWTPPAQGGHDE